MGFSRRTLQRNWGPWASSPQARRRGEPGARFGSARQPGGSQSSASCARNRQGAVVRRRRALAREPRWDPEPRAMPAAAGSTRPGAAAGAGWPTLVSTRGDFFAMRGTSCRGWRRCVGGHGRFLPPSPPCAH